MKHLLIGLCLALFLITGCSRIKVLDSAQSIEVLKADPDQAYMATVYYFCPMDISAVPYLIEKLSDSNINIRRNAANILGKWLITPEAIEPFKSCYFKEPDVLVRKTLLDALALLMIDPDQAKSFFSMVVQKEQSPKLKRYARGLLEDFDRNRSKAVDTFQTVRFDAEQYTKEYNRLYQSSGRKGDLDLLLGLSRPEDENALKALRIRILKRNTDGALFDYQKINSVILLHRYVAG